MTDDRAAFEQARAAGLRRRHEQRLTRRCRYGVCTNEAVDPDARILLCEHHLILAVELVASGAVTE
jgi:hypothetical protein